MTLVNVSKRFATAQFQLPLAFF